MRFRLLICFVTVAAFAGGCQRGPFRSAMAPAEAPGPAQINIDQRLSSLNQRASQLDSNNQDLHSQLAQSERQVKLLTDEVRLLQERLADTARQLKEQQVARRDEQSRAEAFQTSSSRPGMASLKPNNSLKQSLRVAEVAGLDVLQEQDVIRIVIPADRLFRPLTVEYERDAEKLAGEIADSIARNYPRNRIVVEAHVDDSVSSANVGPHQLTASQGLAVVDLLVRVGRLPESQLTMMALGANQPRASNGTNAGRERNRRLELVVYPEQFD